MAYEEKLCSITLPAAGDLSAAQYRFLSVTNVSGEGRVQAAAPTTRPVGVLQNKPSAAGQAATVAISGVSKVVAGSAVNAGDPVASDAQGRAVPVVTSTDYEAGIALRSATQAGEVIPVLLTMAMA